MSQSFRDAREFLFHTPGDPAPWHGFSAAPYAVKQFATHMEKWFTDVYLPLVSETTHQIKEESASSHLCFLDMTLSDQHSRTFAGILAAPSTDRWQCYLKTVKAIVSRRRTVGSHSVFHAGIPLFRGPDGAISRPQTKNELDAFRETLAQRKTTLLGDSFLYHEFPQNLDAQLKSSFPREDSLPEEWCVKPVNKTDFGYDQRSYQYRRAVSEASAEPIVDNWALWMKLLATEARFLTDSAGRALSCVVGIPLCIWDINSRSLSIPVAQIFMGFGGALRNSPVVQRLVSGVVTYALRANAGLRARAEGELDVQRIFAHQGMALLMNVLSSDKDNLSKWSLYRLTHLLRLVQVWQRDQPDMSGIFLQRFYAEDLYTLIYGALLQGVYRVSLDTKHSDQQKRQAAERVVSSTKVFSEDADRLCTWAMETLGLSATAMTIPDQVLTEPVKVALHHCLWQAAYHGFITALSTSRPKPHLQMVFSDDGERSRIEIRNSAWMHDSFESRDRLFFERLNAKFEGMLLIVGPDRCEGEDVLTCIEIYRNRPAGQ